MREPITILLIEDNLADVRIIQELLEEGGYLEIKVRWAETLDEGLKRLEQDRPDCVLLDLNLADSRGLNTFLTLHDQFPDVPVVILTGQHDEELGAATVRSGAQDFLPKTPINIDHLVRSVWHAIARLRRQMNSAEARDKAESERELDNLKGITSTEARTQILRRVSIIEEYAQRVRDFLVRKDADPIATARELAQEFFDQDRSGREVIHIHLKAMEHLTKGIDASKSKMLAEKGRLLVLGVMTNLADLYRERASQEAPT